MIIQNYKFQQHGDERGHLTVIEGEDDIPFKIERVYYLYDTKDGVVRGLHAHKKLQQILVCVNGTCKIRLDDGRETTVIELNSPKEGIYVGANVWREMYDFSENAVLLVMASEKYDEQDYIRNYEAFIEKVNKKEEM